ncbi:VOC family protein [Paracoccus seriniphilus]|uniref:Glyoxalase/Bleomycin resistance protein/Dioxygenase superfamily protein n=2 Tax=Paracoccus seriniphilus TaxID=184748 RepID=A0A239PVH1_9RHOB|nr:VOC family protein [Paracoccus seriniphilus]SNT73936.1 Glyoxalase/Bleomycin resistance protein/Dioxygenase superfamily protein [Paracoccus seriniphilus]
MPGQWTSNWQEVENWHEFRPEMICDDFDPIMKDWKLVHLGIVVKKMDPVVNFWKKTGIAQFDNKSFIFDASGPVPGLKYYGEPCDPEFKARWRVGQIGAIPVEIGEMLGGRSPYKDHLDKFGEGIHHVAFSTPNWQESYDYLVSKGMPCMMEGSLGGWAYFDAHALGGGVNIELIDFNTKGYDWFARLVD